jgi:hypothetical protein
MNDTTFARQLATALAADNELAAAFVSPDSADVNIVGEQSAAILTARPSITISGEYEPFGSRRKGTVSLELLGRLADSDGHAERFDALWEKLFGAQGATPEITRSNAAAAKAALKTTLAGMAVVELIEYGPASDAIDAGAEGDDLRTVLNLRVAWRFV